jgi:two-component system sensor histidine kinase KdpD
MAALVIGLAIVKELTAAQRGDVTAAEAPGGGAEFTLRIPPARPPLPAAAPASERTG